MTPPTHEPGKGSRSNYVMGCRCPECRARNREYTRAYWRQYRRHVEGVPHVDPAPVVAHLTVLRAQGMGVRRISEASGVPVNTIRHAYRTRKGIRPHTARALLAVTPDPYLTDVQGSQRRVRALARMGWTRQAIATTASVGLHIVANLMAGTTTQVTRDHADAIARAYDDLSMRPGPSRVARRYAEAQGWPPPLAWDDPDTDHAPMGVAA